MLLAQGDAVTTAADATGGHGSVGSDGWVGGFGTSMLADHARRIMAILLTRRLMRGADDTQLNAAFQKDALYPMAA